jgi:hypothetical protein
MARKTHKDVEFEVEAGRQNLGIFKSFNEAAGIAVASALSGSKTTIDILVYSRAGARWLEGEDGAEQYDSDPDASVFKRIVIRADDQGMVA